MRGQIPTLEISGATLASNKVPREHVLGPAGQPHPSSSSGVQHRELRRPLRELRPSFADQQAGGDRHLAVEDPSAATRAAGADLREQLAKFPTTAATGFGRGDARVRGGRRSPVRRSPWCSGLRRRRLEDLMLRLEMHPRPTRRLPVLEYGDPARPFRVLIERRQRVSTGPASRRGSRRCRPPTAASSC